MYADLLLCVNFGKLWRSEIATNRHLSIEAALEGLQLYIVSGKGGNGREGAGGGRDGKERGGREAKERKRGGTEEGEGKGGKVLPPNLRRLATRLFTQVLQLRRYERK